MPPEDPGRPPDKLSVVVFSGDFERVHYALAMASAAAAVDKPATLFFTMEAIHGLGKRGADGSPGWRRLKCADGTAAGDRDGDYGRRGVATFEELIGACAQLGVTFMVCEMGLRAIGLEPGDLRDDIAIAQGGTVTFLNDASAHGSMVFV